MVLEMHFFFLLLKRITILNKDTLTLFTGLFSFRLQDEQRKSAYLKEKKKFWNILKYCVKQEIIVSKEDRWYDLVLFDFMALLSIVGSLMLNPVIHIY